MATQYPRHFVHRFEVALFTRLESLDRGGARKVTKPAERANTSRLAGVKGCWEAERFVFFHVDYPKSLSFQHRAFFVPRSFTFTWH
jgi:hypothetical protein